VISFVAAIENENKKEKEKRKRFFLLVSRLDRYITR
jgi:hypothetical protein